MKTPYWLYWDRKRVLLHIAVFSGGVLVGYLTGK